MLAKLRPEDGLYLIHWSTSHFNRLILTVAQKDQVGQGRGSWAVAGYSPCLSPCSLPSPCHLPPCPQAPGGQCLRLRKFPIELHAGTFTLESWDRSFPSVRELRAALQGYLLRAGDDRFSLRHCCLPQPGGKMGCTVDRAAAPPCRPSVTLLSPPEISNLIIRWGPEASTKPLGLSQLSFHRVCQDDITQVCAIVEALRACGLWGGQLPAAVMEMFPVMFS